MQSEQLCKATDQCCALQVMQQPIDAAHRVALAMEMSGRWGNGDKMEFAACILKSKLLGAP